MEYPFWHCKKFNMLSLGRYQSLCQPRCCCEAEIKASQAFQRDQSDGLYPDKAPSGTQVSNEATHTQGGNSCSRGRFYTLQTGEMPFCVETVRLYGA